MADYLQSHHSEQEGFKVTPEIMNSALEYYRANHKYIMEAALREREEAVSHRGCKVGSCVIAINPKFFKRDYAIYTDHNVTPAPNLNRRGKDKRCAERNALERATDDGCEFFPAMATVSNFVDTGDPSKGHDVLHPCKDCRDLWREFLAKGFLSRESIFCSGNDVDNGEDGKTLWRIEEMAVGELLDLYHDDLE